MLKPNFDEEKYTSLLAVPKELINFDLLKNLAQKNGFTPKDEMHVTIIGFKTGREIDQILKKLSSGQKAEIIEKIKTLLADTDWQFNFKPKYYHITKDYFFPKINLKEHRESYIQLLDCPGIKEFYGKLNELLASNLPSQFSHLTLYTKGSDSENGKAGIGINSQKDFEQLNPQLIEIS